MAIEIPCNVLELYCRVEIVCVCVCVCVFAISAAVNVVLEDSSFPEEHFVIEHGLLTATWDRIQAYPPHTFTLSSLSLSLSLSITHTHNTLLYKALHALSTCGR